MHVQTVQHADLQPTDADHTYCCQYFLARCELACNDTSLQFYTSLNKAVKTMPYERRIHNHCHRIKIAKE